MENRLPVLFLSHTGPTSLLHAPPGSLMSGIDKQSPYATFLKSVKTFVKSPIKNILIISAHWEESQFTVSYQQSGINKLIYDYGGFDKLAYAPYTTYPAPTDLKLAGQVHDMLNSAGLPCVKQDRGLDHGAFIVLKTGFPEANIPIVQLSLKNNLSPADHIRLGEVLSPLRNEGTLIICSGTATHNIREIIKGGTTPDRRVLEFLEWLRLNIESGTSKNYQETKALFTNVQSNCPHFNWVHPRSEHFVPLLVAIGTTKPVATPLSVVSTAANNVDVVEDLCFDVQNSRIHSEVYMSNFGLDSYIFK